jgi:hypothetical protein
MPVLRRRSSGGVDANRARQRGSTLVGFAGSRHQCQLAPMESWPTSCAELKKNVSDYHKMKTYF